MAALKTHLLRALNSRRDAESEHLAALRRRWELARTAARLDQGVQAAGTIPGQSSPPSKGART